MGWFGYEPVNGDPPFELLFIGEELVMVYLCALYGLKFKSRSKRSTTNAFMADYVKQIHCPMPRRIIERVDIESVPAGAKARTQSRSARNGGKRISFKVIERKPTEVDFEEARLMCRWSNAGVVQLVLQRMHMAPVAVVKQAAADIRAALKNEHWTSSWGRPSEKNAKKTLIKTATKIAVAMEQLVAEHEASEKRRRELRRSRSHFSFAPSPLVYTWEGWPHKPNPRESPAYRRRLQKWKKRKNPKAKASK